MAKRGRKPILGEEEKAWAYEKWCEGYTQQQIADALYVERRTLTNALKDKPRIRPKLVYTGKMGV